MSGKIYQTFPIFFFNFILEENNFWDNNSSISWKRGIRRKGNCGKRGWHQALFLFPHCFIIIGTNYTHVCIEIINNNFLMILKQYINNISVIKSVKFPQFFTLFFGRCVFSMQRDHACYQFHTWWNKEDRPLAPISSWVEA